MLTIGIAAYNYPAQPLVEALEREIAAQQLPVDLLVVDDASTNRSIAQQNAACASTHCKVVLLEQNLGRSGVRNYIAEQCQQEHLLLIDVDSYPVHDNYLAQYLAAIEAGHQLVCGGTAYRPKKPSDNQLLRWTYGHAREARSAAERQAQPFASFTPNNLLIASAILRQHPFPAMPLAYGHEDTLLGAQLAETGLHMQHIDNPVYHEGLEDDAVFLAKSEEALANLKHLADQGAHDILMGIKVYRVYRRTRWCSGVFQALFALKGASMKAQLMSGQAKLWVFDLYKLCYLHHIMA